MKTRALLFMLGGFLVVPLLAFAQSVTVIPTPSAGSVPLTVRFDTNVLSADTRTFSINYGDGTSPVPILRCATAGCPTTWDPTHQYRVPGTFGIRLFQSSTVVASTTVTVHAPPVCRLVVTSKPNELSKNLLLSWGSLRATGGTISVLGAVGPAGSVRVYPKRSGTYVGVFTGPGGSTYCSVSVSVYSATGLTDTAGSGSTSPGVSTGPRIGDVDIDYATLPASQRPTFDSPLLSVSNPDYPTASFFLVSVPQAIYFGVSGDSSLSVSTYRPTTTSLVTSYQAAAELSGGQLSSYQPNYAPIASTYKSLSAWHVPDQQLFLAGYTASGTYKPVVSSQVSNYEPPQYRIENIYEPTLVPISAADFPETSYTPSSSYTPSGTYEPATYQALSGQAQPSAQAGAQGQPTQQTGVAPGPNGLVGCKDAATCDLCAFTSLFQRVINFLIGLTIPLSALLFAWAGILFYTSSGNTGRIEQAKKIFASVAIGIMIALGGWLGVQTILKTVLAPSYYVSWNNIKCEQGFRPGDRTSSASTVAQWLSFLPPIKTNTPPSGENNLVSVRQNSAFGAYCDDGSTPSITEDGNVCVSTSGVVTSALGSYSPPSAYGTCYGGDVRQNGQCIGAFGEEYPPFAVNNSRAGPEGTCPVGSKYTEDTEYAWCQGSGGPEDVVDFQTAGAGGGPILRCTIGAPGCADIAAAMSVYRGAPTGAGPDNGNLACAWSVNNVLMESGIAPIDGNSVKSMEDQLVGGRGTLVNTADGRPGDIIVWKEGGVSHVGFCQNAGCTSAISNSSSEAKFNNISGSTFRGVPGRVYQVNKY